MAEMTQTNSYFPAKAEQFDIVTGSMQCNARCPFCIARMTPNRGMTNKEQKINWKAFHNAAQMARNMEAHTAFLTGKGEPTLFPSQISNYLTALERYDFPRRELQTNGIRIAGNPEKFRPYLSAWKKSGLDLIAVSIVHYDPEANRKIFLPYKKSYIDLPSLADQIHEAGMEVRLSCVLAEGLISDPEGVEGLVNFARRVGADQLTMKPVEKAENSLDLEADKWVEKHFISDEKVAAIRSYLDSAGTITRNISYGAAVYDVNGQNVCYTNCLKSSGGEKLRHVIFFPDGTVAYDWQRDDDLNNYLNARREAYA